MATGEDNNRFFGGIFQSTGNHLIAWCHDKEGGRVFQTGLEHEAHRFL
jgi:hypothetical protein